MTAALFAQEAESGLPWFAFLFWAWVLVGVGYWVNRLYRRTTRVKGEEPHVGKAELKRSSGDRLRPPPARDVAAPSPAGPIAAPDSAHSRDAARDPMQPTSGASPKDRDSLVATPREPATPGKRQASDTTTDPEEVGTTGAAPRSSGSNRSGLFAPATPKRDKDAARPTVAMLLQGISMPCDLAPIVVSEPTVSADLGLQVVFATNTATAAEVGQSLGDELERLGFALESTSDTEVEAERDDGRLRVSLVPDPGERKREGKRIYPSLPPESIVVEFESI